MKEQIRHGVLNAKRFAFCRYIEDKDGVLYFKSYGEIVDTYDYSDAAKQIEAEMDEHGLDTATIYVDTVESFIVTR